MPLHFFYTMVQKVKMTKNSIQGGPALKRIGQHHDANLGPFLWENETTTYYYTKEKEEEENKDQRKVVGT